MHTCKVENSPSFAFTGDLYLFHAHFPIAHFLLFYSAQCHNVKTVTEDHKINATKTNSTNHGNQFNTTHATQHNSHILSQSVPALLDFLVLFFDNNDNMVECLLEETFLAEDILDVGHLHLHSTGHSFNCGILHSGKGAVINDHTSLH